MEKVEKLIHRRFDYAQRPMDQFLNFFPYTCLSNTHTPMPDVKIEASWKTALAEEFEKPYFQALIDFLKK